MAAGAYAASSEASSRPNSRANERTQVTGRPRLTRTYGMPAARAGDRVEVAFDGIGAALLGL